MLTFIKKIDDLNQNSFVKIIETFDNVVGYGGVRRVVI